MEQVLEGKLTSTYSSVYKLYMVKWEGMPNSFKSQISETNLVKYSRHDIPDAPEPGGSEVLIKWEDDVEHPM